jgi:hypothetical protein
MGIEKTFHAIHISTISSYISVSSDACIGPRHTDLMLNNNWGIGSIEPTLGQL